MPTKFKEGNKTVTRKPDFTLNIGDKKYYWEHLGLLDVKEYSKNWEKRRSLYHKNGLSDKLITTDDMNGIKIQKLSKILDDLIDGALKETKGNKFSDHHYELY